MTTNFFIAQNNTQNVINYMKRSSSKYVYWIL